MAKKISIRDTVRYKGGVTPLRVTTRQEQDGGPTIIGFTWIDKHEDQRVGSAFEDQLELVPAEEEPNAA